MQQTIINPWTWQDQIGYSQAIEITNGQHVLYCAGQASMDADGKPAHPGDMRAQLFQCLDNLEAVLTQAGYTLSNVVRLNVYTTDVETLFQNWDAMATRLTSANVRPTSTLLGVASLTYPDLLIEIEATAVR